MSFLISLLYVCILALTACASTPPPEPASPAVPEAVPTDAAPTEPAASETPAIWRDTTTGLQHINSGVTCPLATGDFDFTGEVIFPGQGAGKDVACNYIAEAGGAIRLHITKFPRAISTDAYLKGSLETIRDRYRSTAPVAPPPDPEGAPITEVNAALRTDSRSAKRPDIPVDTALWIEEIGGWHIKLRATYEVDRKDAVGAAASILFRVVRSDLATPPLY
ncbi:MAG: hypothetical protein AAF950_16135 [Pseudomonadota bacterium]